jgi:hypothetical protein
MEIYGLPPIGQKQERPMDGAQFHSRTGRQCRWGRYRVYAAVASASRLTVSTVMSSSWPKALAASAM